MSWVLAATLTAGSAPALDAQTSEPRLIWGIQAPLLLSALCGGALLAFASLRADGDVATIGVTGILAAPLLVTLITDILARQVFPLVLLPGLLAALMVNAVGPSGLSPALTSGVGAAGVTALLVVMARWRWPDATETPLGGGDILIAATIGAMFGPAQSLVVLCAGVFMAGVAAALLLIARRASRQDAIPYGAFLCAAALAALAM